MPKTGGELLNMEEKYERADDKSPVVERFLRYKRVIQGRSKKTGMFRMQWRQWRVGALPMPENTAHRIMSCF